MCFKGRKESLSGQVNVELKKKGTFFRWLNI